MLAHRPLSVSVDDATRQRGLTMTLLGTMHLSRIRIALRASLPALQRRLPDAWEIVPDSSDIGKGSNLAVLFYEVYLNQAAEGSDLIGADPVGRYFVLGMPSRHRQTAETAFMVFRIFTAHPTGENPFGWKGVAAGKTTAHAMIARTQTLEASGLETMVSDRVEARTDVGLVEVELRYRRGVPYKIASERRVRFTAEPAGVRIYRADEVVDVVKSVPTGVDRLDRCRIRVTMPEFADIFDGSEQTLNVVAQPWYLRQVYVPSGA